MPQAKWSIMLGHPIPEPFVFEMQLSRGFTALSEQSVSPLSTWAPPSASPPSNYSVLQDPPRLLNWPEGIISLWVPFSMSAWHHPPGLTTALTDDGMRDTSPLLLICNMLTDEREQSGGQGGSGGCSQHESLMLICKKMNVLKYRELCKSAKSETNK